MTQTDGPLFPWVLREHARGRGFILLCALITLLAVHPYVEGADDGASHVLRIVHSVTLVAAVYAVSRRPWALVTAIALALPAMAIHWSPGWEHGRGWAIARDMAVIAFYLLTIIELLNHVFRGTDVTNDQLYDAASAYLLIGLTFAHAYSLVLTLNPTALQLTDATRSDGEVVWSELIYFSFGTLSTSGFGQVSPLSPTSRMLTVFEALLGAFYMAVLIARLVARPRASATDSK